MALDALQRLGYRNEEHMDVSAAAPPQTMLDTLSKQLERALSAMETGEHGRLKVGPSAFIVIWQAIL